MAEKNFYNANLILSKGDIKMDISSAKAICDDIIYNCTKDSKIGSFSFFNIENCINEFKEIVEYIRSKSNSMRIAFTITNTDLLDEEFIKFCKFNSIRIIYTTEDFVIDKKLDGCDRINIRITDINIDKLFEFYENLSYGWDADIYFELDDSMDKQVDKLNRQIDKIIDRIIEAFEKPQPPIIPRNFLPLLFAIVLDNFPEHQDKYTYNRKLNFFNSDVGKYVTATPELKMYAQNYFGKDCCDAFYLGEYDKYFFMKTPIKIKDLEDRLFKDIQDTRSLNFTCRTCPAEFGCYANNFAENQQNRLRVNVQSNGMCVLNNCFMKGLERLVLYMDETKNEIFKTYLFDQYKRRFER